MNKIAAALAISVVLAGCASGGGSTADLSGKDRLKTLLTEKFNEEGQEVFKDDPDVPAEEQPRAVGCMLDALMADMSNAQANRLADMFERKIPSEKDFVLYWVVPRDSGHPERAVQVENRVRQICPDLAEKML